MNKLIATAVLCFFAIFTVNELRAQGQFYTSFPDIDGDGFKEPLTAGATYDINDFTFTFPGNVNIRNTGDSIAFLAVFLATGCQSNCADMSLPFYHSSGQMFGVMGADRRYHGSVSFPMPGEYLLVGVTKNGSGIRETVEVTNCPIPDTIFITNTVYVTVSDTLVIEFALTAGTTGTTMVENLNEQIYPNPVSEILFFKGLPDESMIKVFTSAGEEIATLQNPTEFTVSQLPPGFYFIKAFKGGIQFANAKVIKQ